MNLGEFLWISKDLDGLRKIWTALERLRYNQSYGLRLIYMDLGEFRWTLMDLGGVIWT